MAGAQQSPPNFGALKDLKVVEIGQLIAGPFAGKCFADFGAHVIKIEPPEGDPLRKWRKLHNGTSVWWHVQNRRKQSVTVNLRLAQGQALVRRLIADADVVIENFRPGTLEKWGLGYELLAKENPRLIMLRMSGFGQDGPYRDQTGFGSVGESMGGLRYVTGFPDQPPVRPNISIGDALAALHGVIGVLSALHERERSGLGQVVDVALYEAVFNMMEGALPEYALFGAVREREGTTLTGIVPSNTYTSADHKHIIVGGNGDSIFKRLMVLVGRPDLAEDPGLADNAGRVPRAGELDEAIGGWIARHDAEFVLKALSEAQGPAGKTYSIADIARDPQYQAREMIREVQLADGTALKVPGVIPKLSRTPGDIGIGPELGEHTEQVLLAHGLSRDEITRLRADKVI